MALIEIEALERIYQDGSVATPALRGVSFSIENGEFVAVMGPSGSGKSTLLHILGFLDGYTGGEYRFQGKPAHRYDETEKAHIRNATMGFVFQSFNLLSKTSVLENVKLPLLYSAVPKHEWDARARKALEAVGLTHRLAHDSSQLSGGERQRVAIARALITHPQVIFADEPTGNLDSKSGRAVMGILERLHNEERHTIILITHETYTAERAERIIKLADGELVSDQRVAERAPADTFIK
ncbi:MAG: ABC transporter ATP-binding protein [Candidatus Liptonbacteria bacterium]|nr:ABC transporter ATP-binding protein [Candidatus Liptonbacteria bacterium]